MTFPTEPTVPLPTWATDVGAVKVDPGVVKRGEGWVIAGPGLQYGEAPPFPWVNHELFNNGTWATYFKDGLDYVKAGNFDFNVTVEGFVSAKNGVKISNGNTLQFFASNQVNSVSIQANPVTFVDTIYRLPTEYPSTSNYDSTLTVNEFGFMGSSPIGLNKFIRVTDVDFPVAAIWKSCATLTVETEGRWLVTGMALMSSIGGVSVSLHVGKTTSSTGTQPFDAVSGDNFITFTSTTANIANAEVSVSAGSTTLYLNMKSGSIQNGNIVRLSAFYLGRN